MAVTDFALCVCVHVHIACEQIEHWIVIKGSEKFTHIVPAGAKLCMNG